MLQNDCLHNTFTLVYVMFFNIFLFLDDLSYFMYNDHYCSLDAISLIRIDEAAFYCCKFNGPTTGLFIRKFLFDFGICMLFYLAY